MEVSDDQIETSQEHESAFEPIMLSIKPLAAEESADETSQNQGFHGWTLMLIAAGISLIACCFLIPQADVNRGLSYECLRLQADLDHLNQQSAVNEEFIRRVGTDPALTERLAQRQMRFVREGTQVLNLNEHSNLEDKSPYSLLAIDPPAEVPTFRTPQSRLANICRDTKSRLYVLGAGLMLLATGLVLGSSGNKE